jgi:hypothetical protein
MMFKALKFLLFLIKNLVGEKLNYVLITTEVRVCGCFMRHPIKPLFLTTPSTDVRSAKRQAGSRLSNYFQHGLKTIASGPFFNRRPNPHP